VIMRRSTVIACALVACVGCGSNNDTAMGTEKSNEPAANASSAGTDDRAARSQPVTYEGCIQKGGGLLANEYLLTMMSEPAGAAATTGSLTKTGSSVEREQMRAAALTYRLHPVNDVKLDDMVGKQVRVTGTISEHASVPTGSGGIGSDQDSQRPNRDSRDRNERGVQISTADLARLDVSSATVTGESCGSLGRESSGRIDAETAGTDRTPRSRR